MAAALRRTQRGPCVAAESKPSSATIPATASRLNSSMGMPLASAIRTTELNAGLGGLPQISLPMAELDGLPLGLSFNGPRGADMQLLGLARSLMPKAGLQVRVAARSERAT